MLTVLSADVFTTWAQDCFRRLVRDFLNMFSVRLGVGGHCWTPMDHCSLLFNHLLYLYFCKMLTFFHILMGFPGHHCWAEAVRLSCDSSWGFFQSIFLPEAKYSDDFYPKNQPSTSRFKYQPWINLVYLSWSSSGWRICRMTLFCRVIEWLTEYKQLLRCTFIL